MNANVDRREFLRTATGSIAACLLAAPAAAATSRRSPARGVAFDALTVFDPRPVIARAEEVFPGHGAELGQAWRTRQFEYTWLRTAAGRYEDFWRVTEDALVFAAKMLNLDLDPPRRAHLMSAYLELRLWPDVLPALKSLQASGIRLALLSNFSPRMLKAGIKNSGLQDVFEHLLSTDAVRQFKPAPRAYQLAVDAFELKPDAIVFAAFAGWDASGAKWFGFPTVWINRLSSPPEELSAIPDAACSDLSGLVTFAMSRV